MAEQVYGKDRLLLGIDLGSATTAVVSNRGYRNSIPSVVGYPKDIIAIKMLGKTQVFGDEALEKHSALTLYHPMRDAVIQEGGKRDYNASAELLRHVIGLATNGEAGPVSGIIAAPARTSPAGKEALQRIASQLLDAALVISDPILVAYHLDQLDKCLVIDIGASTIDICAVKGTVPSPQDQAILPKAGEYIDDRLQSMISQHYPDVQITRNLARRIKEEHGFVGQAAEPVLVTLRSRGKPRQYDVTSELGMVCESIVPEILEQLTSMLKAFDPEDQENALQNIYLAGGGAHLRGLNAKIAEAMRDYGQVLVRSIEEPEYAGARGALRLATDLPLEKWQAFGLSG